MRTNFRHALLTQIEMLRGAISHEELSANLGSLTERYLARYVAGKTHLPERDFYQVARALRIAPRVLAEQWAAGCGLRIPARLADKDAIAWIRERAYRHWRRHSPLAQLSAGRVPPSPSPMTILRERYADRLPRRAPALSFCSRNHPKPTPEGRRQFARAYAMLVQFVHGSESQRTIGAMHGLSGERVRQLMQHAAYTWARSQGIDLNDKSVPFKSDAKLVKNLYAGLRFFAQQHFDRFTQKGAAK